MMRCSFTTKGRLSVNNQVAGGGGERVDAMLSPLISLAPIRVSLLVLLTLAALFALLGLDGKQAAAEDELEPKEIEWLTDPQPDRIRNKEGAGAVRWGGGSFLHLIGGLSIAGCNVDAIAIWTPEEVEQGYRRISFSHHFRAPDFVNRDFGQGKYTNHIPKHSVASFTCMDECDVFVGPGAAGLTRQNTETCRNYNQKSVYGEDRATDCLPLKLGADRNAFAELMPIFHNTCLLYVSSTVRSSSSYPVIPSGGASGYVGYTKTEQGYAYMVSRLPYIQLNIYAVHTDYNADKVYTAYTISDFSEYTDGEWLLDRDNTKDYFSKQGTLMHELCHINQFWYINKFYNTYKTGWSAGKLDLHTAWEETQAGQAFIEMMGYTKEGKRYIIPEDSPYEFISRSDQPLELSAELCSTYYWVEVYADSDNEYISESISYVRRELEEDPALMNWFETYLY